ncbi:hypothetical protein NOVOSPHI9U_210002 [Novosphingobium sp. 9U]|nr:hypothetical protein NOVOSPHI9U_210002 [Novosphingobium sp. 9U]
MRVLTTCNSLNRLRAVGFGTWKLDPCAAAQTAFPFRPQPLVITIAAKLDATHSEFLFSLKVRICAKRLAPLPAGQRHNRQCL